MCLAAAYALVARDAIADGRLEAQVALDATVGGGFRYVPGNPAWAFFHIGLYADALLGARDGPSNAPRVGPFAALRVDVGAAHSSVAPALGVAAMLLGRRDENHVFETPALVVGVGAVALFDDATTGASPVRAGGVARAFYGARIAWPVAIVALGFFAEYRVLGTAPDGVQQDVVVGIELAPLTLLIGPIMLLHSTPSMHGH